MKKYALFLANFVLISTLVTLGWVTSLASTFNAQDGDSATDVFAAERSPFDFSDKFYSENGVEPGFIFNRRNGEDGLSVLGYIDDPNYRGVRITATFPAYDADGSPAFFNLYGELYKESFIHDGRGDRALEMAEHYPIFEFPSETVKHSNRQATLIKTDAAYFEKNQLGLGIVIIVEFTERIDTQKGSQIIRELGLKNGLSLDGTPIIRTFDEINYLTQRGLVTQKVKGQDGSSAAPFAIARVIFDPTKGAIARDAYLQSVLQNTGQPLASEQFFQETFGCLQKSLSFCSDTKQ